MHCLSVGYKESKAPMSLFEYEYSDKSIESATLMYIKQEKIIHICILSKQVLELSSEQDKRPLNYSQARCEVVHSRSSLL